MMFEIVFFCGSAFITAILLTFCIFLLAISSPYPIIKRSDDEDYYFDPLTKKLIKFPSINDPYSINLSVIIPAFNEEKRLPEMLKECIEFLQKRIEKNSNFKYEIIVVSDGSTDDTINVANNYAYLGTNKFRILNLKTNRGKGGAVRLGMQSARGAILLFADADGATKFSDLTKLEDSLLDLIKIDYLQDPDRIAEELAIVIGSRAHLQDDAIASRSLFRTILMYGFHFLVWLFAVRNLKDTQCGFKLFTRKAARICFESLHVERWAFDVELLYIAQNLKIPISEIAVNWTEIEGSKLTPFWSSVQMGKDLALIWLRYSIGAWKIKAQTKKD